MFFIIIFILLIKKKCNQTYRKLMVVASMGIWKLHPIDGSIGALMGDHLKAKKRDYF